MISCLDWIFFIESAKPPPFKLDAEAKTFQQWFAKWNNSDHLFDPSHHVNTADPSQKANAIKFFLHLCKEQAKPSSFDVSKFLNHLSHLPYDMILHHYCMARIIIEGPPKDQIIDSDVAVIRIPWPSIGRQAMLEIQAEAPNWILHKDRPHNAEQIMDLLMTRRYFDGSSEAKDLRHLLELLDQDGENYDLLHQWQQDIYNLDDLGFPYTAWGAKEPP